MTEGSAGSVGEGENNGEVDAERLIGMVNSGGTGNGDPSANGSPDGNGSSDIAASDASAARAAREGHQGRKVRNNIAAKLKIQQAALKSRKHVAKAMKRKADEMEEHNSMRAPYLKSSRMNSGDDDTELEYIRLIRKQHIEKLRKETDSAPRPIASTATAQDPFTELCEISQCKKPQFFSMNSSLRSFGCMFK